MAQSSISNVEIVEGGKIYTITLPYEPNNIVKRFIPNKSEVATDETKDNTLLPTAVDESSSTTSEG